MKRGLFILFVLLIAGCKEDDIPTGASGRRIRSIDGQYTTEEKPSNNKTFRYDFLYDTQGRVVSLTFEGDMYVYGDGLIRARYTWNVDYGAPRPAVTLRIDGPTIGGQPYDGLPQREELALSFGEHGTLSSIAGRKGWLHPVQTALAYNTDSCLIRIAENNNSFSSNRIDLTWQDGELVSQTRDELSASGGVLYRIRRQFAPSALANDYSVDLNWLAGDLGLNHQNALSVLGLLGLTGERSPRLIGSTTENDGTRWPVSYTLEGGRIGTIVTRVAGGNFTFRLGYE